MSLKRNDWKVLKIFTVAVIAAIFSASLSKAVAVQAQALSELTIEERLAKVRERLKQTAEQSDRESDPVLFLQNSLETEQDKAIQAQWSNYWKNWNDWRDWNDVNQTPSSDADQPGSDVNQPPSSDADQPGNNWSDWSDPNWNNWSDWSDWNNRY
jgi:hypothetical protein